MAFGQQCNCVKDTLLGESVDCSPTIFDNKARIYWSFNCDSSWLTFENGERKRILFSMELVSYTGRLGFSYSHEYKKYFLIKNNVISGCCSPPEYFLFDKGTGMQKKSLGRVLYVSDDKAIPIIIKITNSGYDIKKKEDYASFTVLNINTGKQFKIPLSHNDITVALKNLQELYPELLFDEPAHTGHILTLKYQISAKPLKIKTVVINLKDFL